MVEPAPATIRVQDQAFVAGGTLSLGAASYIEREADRALLACLLSGEYAYVLNPRQMGKSSLCVRTMDRLEAAGVKAVLVDLSRIGSQNVNPEQWYAGQLGEIGRGLRLRRELLKAWQDQPDLSPVERFFAVLHDLLEQVEAPIVIFLDEIDATRSLPFPADEFFAGIRELFNRRAVDPACRRLTFCLLGVAVAGNLVRDPNLSPFNIGRSIVLQDFSWDEVLPLAKNLGPDGEANLARIYRWTNGHPYLTQSLCAAVEARLRDAGHGVQPEHWESGAPNPDPRTLNPDSVDALIEQELLDASAMRTNVNLADVASRVLFVEGEDPDKRRQEVLSLYERARRKGSIPDDETNPCCAQLKTSGLMRAEGGKLTVRNEIYRRVFGRTWIRDNMPAQELRRQHRAYRLGVVRAGAVAILFIGGLSYLAFANHRLAVVNEARTLEARRQAQAAQYENYVDQMALMQVANEDNGGFSLRNLLDATKNSPYRNIEWRYWYGQLHDADREIDFPKGDAHVAISADGKTLTVFDTETLERRFYTYPDLKLLRTGKGGDPPFRPNAPFRISDDHKRAEYIDVATGAVLGTVRVPAADPGTIYSAGASMDETACVVVVNGARAYRADIYSLPGMRLLHSFQTPDALNTVDVSSGGRRLAAWTGGEERVIDFGSNRTVFRIPAKFLDFPSLSNDGRLISFWEYDHRSRVWDVDKGAVVFERPSQEPIATAYFSRDGRTVLTGNNRIVEAWDRLTGRLLARVRGVASEAIAPDGRSLVTAGCGVRVYRIPRPIPDAPMHSEATLFGFVGDHAVFAGPRGLAIVGRSLDLAHADWQYILGWSNDLKWQLNREGGDMVVGSFPNGRTLFRAKLPDGFNDFEANFHGSRFAIGTPTGVLIYDSEGKQILTFKGGADPIRFLSKDRVAFKVQGSKIAIGSLITGHILRTLSADTERFLLGFSASPDGHHVAFGGWWNAYIFDVDTEAPPVTISGHNSAILRTEFSADGTRFLTASGDGTARLWDTRTGRQVLELKGDGHSISFAGFDDANHRIVVQNDLGSGRGVITTYPIPP